jgi:DNA-binding NarL/FixJ family response regulator
VLALTRVLIVGDDNFLLAYAKSRLEQDYAIQVTTAPSTAVAQSSLEPRAFDVIIFDREKPAADGANLLEKLHETNRDVQVIFCSRKIRPENVDGFSFNGNKILLHKSDDLDMFCDDLGEILHCIRGEYPAHERHHPPVSGSGWIERIFQV